MLCTWFINKYATFYNTKYSLCQQNFAHQFGFTILQMNSPEERHFFYCNCQLGERATRVALSTKSLCQRLIVETLLHLLLLIVKPPLLLLLVRPNTLLWWKPALLCLLLHFPPLSFQCWALARAPLLFYLPRLHLTNPLLASEIHWVAVLQRSTGFESSAVASASNPCATSSCWFIFPEMREVHNWVAVCLTSQIDWHNLCWS